MQAKLPDAALGSARGQGADSIQIALTEAKLRDYRVYANCELS